MKFDENAEWRVEIPKPTTYAGDIFYHEGTEPLKLWWEIGSESPYAIIYPSGSSGDVPQYVLERVATAFQTDFLQFAYGKDSSWNQRDDRDLQ